MNSTTILGVAAAFLFSLCAPPGSRAQASRPASSEIDYLTLVHPPEIKALIDKHNLGSWLSQEYDLFENFPKFRADLVALIEDKALMPRGTLSALPQPMINRMMLVLLMRKARVIGTNGEGIAFMAKYLLDGKSVRWIMLGGDEDDEFAAAVESGPQKGRGFKLNCAQFVQYASLLAGLPPDANANSDTKNIRKQLSDPLLLPLVDPYMMGLGKFQGWWAAHAGKNGPLSYKGIGMRPGDLIGIFGHESENNKDAGWTFLHVEVIAKPNHEDDNETMSIGNSGQGPHFSNLLGKSTRFGQGIAETFSLSSVNEYRYVIFRFDDRHLIPLKLDISAIRQVVPIINSNKIQEKLKNLKTNIEFK